MPKTARLNPGDLAPAFDVLDLNGTPHRLADYSGRKLLLSFYRYSGCPLCNLRMHILKKKAQHFADRGLSVLALFQSSAEGMRKHLSSRSPFPLVADPEWVVYRAYGVEASALAFAKGLVSATAVKAMASGFLPGRMEGNKLTVPADFLINPDGTLHAAFYGTHIGDHMPIETIDAFLRP